MTRKKTLITQDFIDNRDFKPKVVLTRKQKEAGNLEGLTPVSINKKLIVFKKQKHGK